MKKQITLSLMVLSLFTFQASASTSSWFEAVKNIPTSLKVDYKSCAQMAAHSAQKIEKASLAAGLRALADATEKTDSASQGLKSAMVAAAYTAGKEVKNNALQNKTSTAFGATAGALLGWKLAGAAADDQPGYLRRAFQVVTAGAFGTVGGLVAGNVMQPEVAQKLALASVGTYFGYKTMCAGYKKLSAKKEDTQLRKFEFPSEEPNQLLNVRQQQARNAVADTTFRGRANAALGNFFGLFGR